MRHGITLVLVALAVALAALVGAALGADAPAAATLTAGLAAPGGGPSFLALVWAFVNSPVGVTAVLGALTFLLGKVFTAEPAWAAAFAQYRGLFFDAVRSAESAIPDDSPNRAAEMTDHALKLLVKLEPALANYDPADLTRGLTAAHDALKS